MGFSVLEGVIDILTHRNPNNYFNMSILRVFDEKPLNLAWPISSRFMYSKTRFLNQEFSHQNGNYRIDTTTVLPFVQFSNKGVFKNTQWNRKLYINLYQKQIYKHTYRRKFTDMKYIHGKCTPKYHNLLLNITKHFSRYALNTRTMYLTGIQCVQSINKCYKLQRQPTTLAKQCCSDCEHPHQPITQNTAS